MNTPECAFTRDVIRATKSGQWTESLRTHADGCSVCRETVAIVTTMNAVAAREMPHPSPDYRSIWLKARYARRQEQLTKFDVLALAGLTLGGMAGLFMLLILIFPQLVSRVFGISVVPVSLIPSMSSGRTMMLFLAGFILLVWGLTRDWTLAKR